MKRQTIVSAFLFVAMSDAVCWGGDPLPVDVAGRRVVLVAPKGMCFLDETVAWDRGDLEQQRTLGKGVNLTLAGVTDCGELTQIRSGKLKRARYFGYVKSPLPKLGNQPVDMNRAVKITSAHHGNRYVPVITRPQSARSLKNQSGQGSRPKSAHYWKHIDSRPSKHSHLRPP